MREERHRTPRLQPKKSSLHTTYWRRLALGLCPSCAQPNATPDFCACGHCREAKRERQWAYAKRRVTAEHEAQRHG